MDSISTFLMHGVLAASPWVILLYALITTHLTIVSVTILLQCAMCLRAMEKYRDRHDGEMRRDERIK